MFEKQSQKDRLLRELREEVSLLKATVPTVNQKKKRDGFTLSQQLLALHYLGVFKKLEHLSAVKSSKLMSIILNSDIQNTRESLPKLGGIKNNVKSLKNLTLLRNLFTEIGLPDAVKAIDVDLKSFSK